MYKLLVYEPGCFRYKAYDQYGRGRVSNFLRSLNLFNMRMEIDGAFIDAKTAANLKQELDMHHASFTSSFD